MSETEPQGNKKDIIEIEREVPVLEEDGSVKFLKLRAKLSGSLTPEEEAQMISHAADHWLEFKRFKRHLKDVEYKQEPQSEDNSC